MTYFNTRAPSGHRICRHLSCKEMFYRSELVSSDRVRVVDGASDDHVYWCAKTSREYGPDASAPCSLDSCGPSLRCYEP